MNTKHWSLVALPCVVALVALGGCKKKEEETPPPPPAPVATASAPAPIVIAPDEDAGADAGDDAGPKKATGVGHPADVAGLRACCAALRQNAASMPPPNNAFALQAAAVCDQMAGTGASKAAALGPIAAMFKGALPSVCH